MIQKSYDGSSNLYLIPTPIGNMDDMTYRAVKILNKVDVIFSEDTRVTRKLLNYFNINKKLISMNQHTEKAKKDLLIKYLEDNKNVAYVSDRGTPMISDPGYICAKYVINEGYNVVSLPGATAFVPALTSSGIESDKFLFWGFLNSKESKRKKELEKLKDVKETIIFYESPHRLEKTVNNIKNIFGNRKISISREISKKFEEVIREDIFNINFDEIIVKGEFVIIIEGNKEDKKYDDIDLIDHVNQYVEKGFLKKEAIKKVACDRKVSKNVIYNKYHNK